MTQDSINLTLSLALSISIAEIPHATDCGRYRQGCGNCHPNYSGNSDFSSDVCNRILASDKIMVANNAIALRNVRAVISRCPMSGLLHCWTQPISIIPLLLNNERPNLRPPVISEAARR
jgi:hypothetical protein